MEKYDNGFFNYIIENEKVTIIRYIGSGECLIIPKTLGGYEVTAIGKGAFYQCTSLTGIEIPNSVTSIGENAFQGCTRLILTIENEDSYAHKYALENDINYVFAPDTSWLE